MKEEIKVPAMGESIVEATIGEVLKPSGATVAADEELIELETDKVNQVLYAPQAGVVIWNVAPNDVVKIGQVIGYVDAAGEAMAKITPATPTHEISASKKTSSPHIDPVLPPPPLPSGGGARIGKETFLEGLSTSQPVLPLASSLSKPAAITQGLAAQEGRRETRKKMTKIRKIIAQRLVEAMQHTAMLTTFNEVDMTLIMAAREKYKETFAKQHQVRLGLMSFFVKAVVSALEAYPNVNAFIDGEDIVTREYYDISIAVSTERGLIVPVVRDCDRLSFADIEKAVETYAQQAREGGLSPDALQGGCFTITNGGVYGSLLSTPILNFPQSAILGMHKIMPRPVVVNGEIVIRQMMYLALSYDHRLIDGKEAVSFLIHIKNCLEDPTRLLIGLE